jgi:hypothetical protein
MTVSIVIQDVKQERTTAPRKSIMVTTKQIAQTVGVTPRSKQFIFRDEFGIPYDGRRNENLLAALSRSDRTPTLPANVHVIAYALRKSLVTGRANPESANKIYAYTPYQICALVAHVVNANPDATIGDIADDWINDNAVTL